MYYVFKDEMYLVLVRFGGKYGLWYFNIKNDWGKVLCVLCYL